MAKLPWELSPLEMKERLTQPLVPHAPRTVDPLLVRDPVTGLWPGQQTPVDIPDFLRRQPT